MCCYLFLGSHKNEKIQKKYIKRNPKIIGARKGLLECPKNAKIG
jgi:hypothetical protein